MSELIPIWDSKTLTGAEAPPPFIIPNNPNARTLKVNNQSRYWLILSKSQTSVDVDRIEPFSFLIMPFQPDLLLKVDASGDQATSMSPDKEFVDYSTIDGAITYMKGSTQFVGSSSVAIAGDVNIGNSELNVAIGNTPTMNIAAGNSIAITGTPTMNINSMPNVTIGSGTVTVSSATIVNKQLPVGQAYQATGTISYPSGSTSPYSFTVSFLANGTVADVGKGLIFLKSAKGITYNIDNTMYGLCYFADGSEIDPLTTYTAVTGDVNKATFTGPSVLCNRINFAISATTAPSGADTITVYLLIDGSSVLLDTGADKGVPIEPLTSSLNDRSGTISNANTAYTLLNGVTRRNYFLFQNTSSVNMYVNIGFSAAVGGSGSILVPPNGGSIVFEGSFVPNNYISIACDTAGASYVCKWA